MDRLWRLCRKVAMKPSSKAIGGQSGVGTFSILWFFIRLLAVPLAFARHGMEIIVMVAILTVMPASNMAATRWVRPAPRQPPYDDTAIPEHGCSQ